MLLTITDRQTLTLTGVTDLERFDDREVVLYTSLGELTISGHDLRVGAISIEDGTLTVEGEIRSAAFGDRDRTAPLSLIGRLLR